MLTINNIGKIEEGEYEGTCTIWGGVTDVYINISDNTVTLEDCLPGINAQLKRLNENKAELFRALREDDDIVELAEGWVTSGEECEDEDGRYYLTSQGEKVRLPIDPEEMREGLSVEGITAFCDAPDDIMLELFINCAVDYFAGHCIEAFLEADGSFTVNGLAG